MIHGVGGGAAALSCPLRKFELNTGGQAAALTPCGRVGFPEDNRRGVR
jgi:hypothetical protein